MSRMLGKSLSKVMHGFPHLMFTIFPLCLGSGPTEQSSSFALKCVSIATVYLCLLPAIIKPGPEAVNIMSEIMDVWPLRVFEGDVFVCI